MRLVELFEILLTMRIKLDLEILVGGGGGRGRGVVAAQRAAVLVRCLSHDISPLMHSASP